jgi:tRNA G18 (ribose-2'-O)-methylase SpoU
MFIYKDFRPGISFKFSEVNTMGTNSVEFFKNQKYPEFSSMPVIAAWQIMNPENIGNLIRLADNIGAKELFILGEDFQIRISSVKKTAGLSFENISLKFIHPNDFFSQVGSEYKLVAIETSQKSTNIFTTKLPEKVVFILGNERNGLPEEILSKCIFQVHIPMTGKCKSMNVSHALAVALFEWQRQRLF